jgi:type VI secretion system protein ImpC
MPARLEFAMSFNGAPESRKTNGGPMRLLVMGDFSAGGTGQRLPLANRPTHKVDVDNFDQVMKRLAPKLLLSAGELDFEELDDFRPDSLYKRLDVFEALRQARANPSAGQDDLLGSLLGKAAGAPAAAAPAKSPASGIDALIQNIAAKSVVPDRSAQTASYLATVDAAIAEQMRKILHDPAFQSLESAWRGVQWLISSLELDDDLQLHLLDVSRDELLADVVAAQGQLAQAGLHRALADRWRNVPDGEGWALLCGMYAFGASDTDIGLLAALGLIASQAGGPFIATAAPALSEPAGGDATALAGWQALRSSEAAPWIGLAAPRVLLRLPYGRASDPIASFAFEELGPGEPTHGELVWGHASLATALLIGRAFTARGWEMEPGDEREIGDMPAYTFTKNGERDMQACAERYLGEAASTAMLAAGLIPLLSHRQRNALSVMRFQSVAQPSQALAGPWG